MKKNTIVFGLQFGDEGKGRMTDYFARQVDNPLVVRFNGGAQAAHNVVTPEGLHHTFQQFGAGTLAGARTLLSQYMLVDPIRLATEATELTHKLKRWVLTDHYVHCAAPVLTPYHGALNRIKERARGDQRHGSCGNGVGELMADLTGGVHGRPVLRMGELKHRTLLYEKLCEIQRRCQADARPYWDGQENTPEFKILMDHPHDTEVAMWSIGKELNIRTHAECRELVYTSNCVFEGAQGMLLDQDRGFAPHNTWSKCGPDNALALLKDAGVQDEPEIVGVMRSYMTRHGAGPLPSEGLVPTSWFPAEHNQTNDWQQHWRTGALDMTLLWHALQYVPLRTTIALTHMDLPPDVIRLPAVDTPSAAYSDAGMLRYVTGQLPTNQTRTSLVAPSDLQHFIWGITQRRVKYITRGPTHTTTEVCA